jgi:hypothetical protein
MRQSALHQLSPLRGQLAAAPAPTYETSKIVQWILDRCAVLRPVHVYEL